jgi:hypothetical protein
MNERIKELAEQAGFEITPWRDELLPCVHQEGPIDIELEKFAELIVRELVSQLEVEGSDFYYNKNNNYGVITVKYFVSGDSNQMCGEEVQAEFHNGVRGTGRYRLNEKFVEHLMKQNFGVKE